MCMLSYVQCSLPCLPWWGAGHSPAQAVVLCATLYTSVAVLSGSPNELGQRRVVLRPVLLCSAVLCRVDLPQLLSWSVCMSGRSTQLRCRICSCCVV